MPAHTEHFVFAGLIVDPHVGDIGNAVGERGNHATGLQRRPSADVPLRRGKRLIEQAGTAQEGILHDQCCVRPGVVLKVHARVLIGLVEIRAGLIESEPRAVAELLAKRQRALVEGHGRPDGIDDIPLRRRAEAGQHVVVVGDLAGLRVVTIEAEC